MQINTQQLADEAGRMALEIRFKDRAIAELEAEVRRLRDQADALEAAGKAEAEAAVPSPS